MGKLAVRDIGNVLTPQSTASDGRSWTQALQAGWMSRGCGEIRNEADVGWVPRDQLIEVAFTNDDKGAVIRWMVQRDDSPARQLGFSALSYTGAEAPPTA